MTRTPPRVLFVCMHNAGRSQIAEALFNAYASGRAVAASAGIEPVKAVSLTVVATMRDAGFDLSAAKPKAIDDNSIDSADRVITLGLSQEADLPPEIVSEDWPVEDPAGAPIGRVAAIRDDIARRVRALLRELKIEPAG